MLLHAAAVLCIPGEVEEVTLKKGWYFTLHCGVLLMLGVFMFYDTVSLAEGRVVKSNTCNLRRKLRR